MASLHKQHGVFYIRWREHGKNRNKSLHTTDERVANRALKRKKAELAARAGRRTVTVRELAGLYAEHARTYYRDSQGKPTTQLSVVLPVLARLEGIDAVADDFGPADLADLMRQWTRRNRRTSGPQNVGLTRQTVNRYAAIVKQIWRWGVAQSLVDPASYTALAAVDNLKPHRSEARETEPVPPAPEADIDAVREILPPVLQAAIDLQLRTAARPGELLQLRERDLDRSGEIWTAKPRHKNEWRGKGRTLYFGPRAKAIIEARFTGDPDAYLFAVRPSGGPYTTQSYRQAIQRACDKLELPHWSPNQLRHNAATRIRAEFSLEAAQVFLGHSKLETTQVYAETQESAALDVAAKFG